MSEPTLKPKSRRVEAKYDAAQTSSGNTRHWENSDHLSAASSNSQAVRSTLRSRARYEAANNSWLWGMVDTIVEDTVGTGARIQLRSGSTRTKTDEIVESLYRKWHEAHEVDDKVSLSRRSKLESGEVFISLARGQAARGRPKSILDTGRGVELGVQVIEADQIASPTLDFNENEVSGIKYDRFGNPKAYFVLKNHPGSTSWGSYAAEDGQWVAAELMLHYFNRRRPGDARGIPEVTPALPLFALLRRMTLATVESSEHIANIAGMLQTDAPIDGASVEVSELDTIDFERGTIMTLPEGYSYTQADPKQPTTSYEGFRDAILNEIARALKVPFNVAAGNSSGYNYASGRLDFQAYFRSIKVERKKLVGTILTPIFWAWFQEASLIEGFLPPEARTIEYLDNLEPRYFFDGFGHVDPSKEAKGQATRLENGTTTLAEECATEGRDWRDVLDQQAEEMAYREELGLPGPGPQEPEMPEVPSDAERKENGDPPK